MFLQKWSILTRDKERGWILKMVDKLSSFLSKMTKASDVIEGGFTVHVVFLSWV